MSDAPTAGALGPINRIRHFLLASLMPEWRNWLYGVWAGVFTVVVLIILAPLAPVWGSTDAGAGANLGALTTAEKGQVEAATPIEIEQIAKLAFVSDPIAPGAPPAQAVSALPPKELFGVPSDRAAAFNATTADLRTSAADCAGWIGKSASQAPATALAASAQGDMNTLTGGGGDRGFFHYHQGLIYLCGPNAPSAVDQFKTALSSYDAFIKKAGGVDKLSGPQKRRLAQYQAVTGYGLGLAMLAAGSPADKIDDVLAEADNAARRVKAYGEAGPFITLSATSCARGADCDLFNFSTADIDQARLFVWLKEGKPDAAYERLGKRLGGAPAYVAQHPALAADFAAVAAAAGDFGSVSRLYGVVRHDLENNTGTAFAWNGDGADKRPLARLTAVAVATPDPVYVEGDSWWPISRTPSAVRGSFEKHFSGGANWFPPVEVETDTPTIDLWLWMRRERALLLDSHYDLFHQDGAAIDNLGAGDRDLLEDWRRQVTRHLGDALLQRAQVLRKREGLKAARPLLELLAGSDFPWFVEARARITLRTDHAPLSVVIADCLLLALIAALAWMHLQFAAGYRRTFTRRHFQDRSEYEAKAQAAAAPTEPEPEPVAQ
jgi:hypothetical protein